MTYRCVQAPLCYVVPVLDVWGRFDSLRIEAAMRRLREEGSAAAPGFKQPEGVVVFHSAANVLFKATLENDEVPKGLVKK